MYVIICEVNQSLLQVGCIRQDAQGWCTGMTLGDGMGRVVGGGFWMGSTYKNKQINLKTYIR